jgi:hypothetical protein
MFRPQNVIFFSYQIKDGIDYRDLEIILSPKVSPQLRSNTAYRPSLIISLHIVDYSGKMFMPQHNIFFR